MFLNFNILLSQSCFLLTEENQHFQLHQSWAHTLFCVLIMYTVHTSTLSVIILHQNYVFASVSPYRMEFTECRYYV